LCRFFLRHSESLRGDIYKSLMLFGEVGAAKAIVQGGLAYRF
jgi:hypothetical protein